MDFFSKLTLYDILAMVVPGGVMLMLLLRLFGYSWVVDERVISPTLCVAVFIVVSYIIGILNHYLTKYIWRGFRNNPHFLFVSLAKIQPELPDATTCDENYCEKWAECICSYIRYCFLTINGVWLVFVVITAVCPYFEDNICSYTFAILSTFILLSVLIYQIVPKVKCPNCSVILSKYYEAYYYVQENSKNCDFKVIEGQVAFLQSMIIPLQLFIVVPCSKFANVMSVSCRHTCEGCCCVWKAIAAAVVLACLVVIYQQMMKIHERVWLDAAYLKLIKSKA